MPHFPTSLQLAGILPLSEGILLFAFPPILEIKHIGDNKLHVKVFLKKSVIDQFVKKLFLLNPKCRHRIPESFTPTHNFTTYWKADSVIMFRYTPK